MIGDSIVWASDPRTGLTTTSDVGIGTVNPRNGRPSTAGNTSAVAAGIGSFNNLWAYKWEGIDNSWDVCADESNSYNFFGRGLDGSESNPEFTLMRGQKYAFVNSLGQYPLRIQSTPNGSVGTQYNDGLRKNDVFNDTLIWNVQFDAPDTLYYQCTTHTNMGGKINIVSSTRTREEVSTNTGNIDAGTTSDLIITGHRSYMLQKVSVSSAAWVRVYTDAASRDADTSRLHTEDVSPGSGVIAEGYTTTSGITTFKMTPGVIGWNDDETPNRDIYLKVTNNETESADITVTLTIVRMEDA